MVELLKNAVLIGIGMSAMAKEKIEELAARISGDGRFSEEEGQKVINELLEQIKNSRKNMDELIIRSINEALNRLDIPTRSEYNALEERFNELQKFLAVDREFKNDSKKIDI